MSMLTDIKAYFVANGQSSNLFVGRLPPTPDGAVAIFQYAGRSPLFTHSHAGIALDRPSLQVQVRDPVWAVADARAQAIYTLLAAVANTTMAGTHYLRVEPLGAPFLLERDTNDRTIIAANYYVLKNP